MSEPKYLYRYQKMPTDIHRLMDLFVYNKLWFSSPSSFNDPFDCKVMFDSSTITEADLRILLQSFLPESQVDYQLKQNLQSHQQIHAKTQKFTEKINNLANRSRILCLSSINDNILMWSHYSNSHKGYCIQFVKEELDKWRYSKQVKYQDKHLSFSEFITTLINTTSVENKIDFIGLKSSHWKYENEWRYIDFPTDQELDNEEYNINGQYVSFPPDMLTGIIFGCEMKDEDKDAIKHLVKSNPKLGHVRFHEAKKKPNEFGLDIVEIK
jgi:hypothetical protein